MDSFTFQEDLPTYSVTASTFPEGILAAHQKLQEQLPPNDRRNYFGISWQQEDGTIIYKAAAEKMESDGDAISHLDTFVIKNGPYNSFYISDYMSNPESISQAFKLLLEQHEVDPKGYCLEWYVNEKDVKCMVPLGEDYKGFTGLNREYNN